MNNALQKTIPRFFIGSFFIALLCAVIISEFVGEAFFLSFLISFIPGVMTTLIFFVTREKASRYYGRYLLVAFFMPFLIPIIVGLSLHFVFNKNKIHYSVIANSITDVINIS